FKSANDCHGHRIGDLLLIEVTERLKQSFPSDIVLRLGGDEFIILMLNEDEKDALPKLKHFLSNLTKTISIQDIDFSIKGSIGLTQYPKDGDSVDELLRKADIAMYEAKHSRTDIVVFSSTLDEQQKFKNTLETELATALENDEFFLVYQPQINATTGKIKGLETLIRWDNKKLGLVAPDQFISTAEATGHIIDIGQFVLNQSLKEISDFCIKLEKATELSCLDKEEVNLSVNISVQQLFHDDFVQMMSRYAHDQTPDNIRLTVEITESLFIDDLEKAKSILSELRNQGILISLDDFGTGYSSLSSINQLPIDELKVDKSFISDIDHYSQDLSLVQSIISIGKSLSIPVVAEGVETEEQAAILSENHCDSFQGYLFSKPLKIDELLEFVKNYNKKANLQYFSSNF
ncbi:MAG: bifunctional diguanylate cyclase/phosphodiesterase, partial [Gammaproteobacteria bacterium]|nr:bifunctional diguanylate cyclase/phosphodiesterase [Gammaproteobacteria bacterium]